MTANGKLKIVYMDVNDIGLLEMNFKRHALQETEASIRLRGIIDPIGYNPTTGNTFDGNGRTEVLQSMFKRWLAQDDRASPDAVQVPAGVDVKQLRWMVPTVHVPMTADQEVSAAAALNRIGEMGGYDEAYMLEVLQELQGKEMLEATGYDDKYLSDLLKRFPQRDGGNKFDRGGSEGENVAGEFTGAVSTVKQVALLLPSEVHLEFVSLTMRLSKPLETKNVTDTVMEALRYAGKNLLKLDATPETE